MDPLLETLKENALTPREDLAKLIGISLEEVNERIKRLEEDGIILGYRAVLDPDKAENGGVTAVIEVRIRPEREGGFDRLANRIAQFSEVQSCYLMSGGYDLLVVIEGKDIREVSTFIAERLSSIDGVISSATHFRLRTYKENGTLLYEGTPVKRLPVAP